MQKKKDVVSWFGVKTLSRVDLPQPLGPRSIQSCPGGTWREQPLSTGNTLPRRVVTESPTSRTSMAGAAGGREAEARTRRLRRGRASRVGRTVVGEEDAEGQQRRGPNPTPPARPCAIIGERRTQREECLGLQRCSARPRPC